MSLQTFTARQEHVDGIKSANYADENPILSLLIYGRFASKIREGQRKKTEKRYRGGRNFSTVGKFLLNHELFAFLG